MTHALCSRFNSNFSILGLNFNLLSKLSLFGHVFFSAGSAPSLLMPNVFVWVGSHLQSTQCEMPFCSLCIQVFFLPFVLRNWQQLHSALQSHQEERLLKKNLWHVLKMNIIAEIDCLLIKIGSWFFLKNQEPKCVESLAVGSCHLAKMDSQ